jgi:hypothetical protein
MLIWQIEGVLERIGDHRCLGICRRDETLCNEMIMERRALPFEKGIEVCRRKRDKEPSIKDLDVVWLRFPRCNRAEDLSGMVADSRRSSRGTHLAR